MRAPIERSLGVSVVTTRASTAMRAWRDGRNHAPEARQTDGDLH